MSTFWKALPRLADLQAELSAFPGARHDDQSSA